MQKISLSKITVALSLCYATQFTYADIVSANGQTQVSRQKGVEIINIATPNQAGLSHNQYNKFNVDKSGAVLNNAVKNSKTELAGNVAANPNLRQQSAKVILNEVVSREPSRLAGKQEIAGQRADYVLANPNGISVDGASFTNTARTSLVVGKPTIEKGNLTGYKVDGDKALTTKGRVSGAESLDLIAPTVNVAGNLDAGKGTVNIISGRNEVKRDQDGKLTVNVLPAQGRVLDGKVAGSIQAGRIRIHSTDNRATLEVSASELKAKEVALTAGNAKVTGTVNQQRGYNEQVASGKIASRTQVSTEKQRFNKSTIQADNLVISVANHLEITGADVQAQQAVISSGKTHLGSVKTKEQEVRYTERQQGRSKVRERDVESKETVHGTTIKADTLKLVSTKEKLTASAAKLDVKNLGLHGEKGTEFKGVVTNSTTEKLSNALNSRVTAQKTGFGNSNVTKQAYNATELNVENHLVTTGGTANFAGVQANVGGDLIAKNSGKLQFTSEVITDISENKQHGVYNVGKRNQRVDARVAQRINQGANFDVKGTTFIEANDGVLVSGSRVVSGKDGLVKINKGNLELKAVNNVHSGIEQSRKNLKRTEKFTSQTLSQGASVESDSNLKVTSNKNINVVGSSIKAAGLLDVAALGNINVSGAKTFSDVGTSYRGLTASSKVDNPKIWLDEEGLISATIDTANDLLVGDLKPTQVPKKVFNDVKNSIKLKGEASATVGYLHQSNVNSEQIHSASELTGSTVNATTGNINVAGSRITATDKDLNIKAKKVTTTAQQDQTKELDSKTAVGLTNTVTVTESGVTNKLSLGVQNHIRTENVTIAQGSHLNAKQNVNINAHRIKHQGTTLTAGNDITQSAKQIQHMASQSGKTNTEQYVNAALSLTSTVSKAGYKGALALEANGGNSATTSTTANPTKINAGGNVVSKADRLQDEGTQYQAGKGVNLTSKRHDITSAQHTQSSQKLDAGVNLGVTLATSNFATGTANVNMGTHYQKNQSNVSQAQKAQLQGQNINIQTGVLHSQADMNATQNVNIDAQNVVLSQSHNTSSNSGAGFKLNVGVGAMAIPGGTAVPSVDFGLNVNKNNGKAVEAVPHTVQGNHVVINGKDKVILQGTHVQAVENATITGKKVSVATAHSVKKEDGVNVGLGFNLGAGASSLGVNGSVNVNKENSHLNPSVSVNAQNVSIQAENGVHLTGVNSNSTNLTINSGKGNVDLNAAQNQVNKTNVGASLALNGGLSGSKWTPTGGSASLNVDVVRNETHSTTALNTQNANIKGKVNAKPVVDKTNEVSVGLSASGSGKFTPYPAGKWVESAKKDWQNGTIAGVSSDIGASVDVNKQTVIKPTGVNPAKPQVVKQQQFKGKVDATTALKAKLKKELMMEIMKQQTQRSKRTAKK